MAQEPTDSFRMLRVKKRISPSQPRASHAKDAPANETPPFADGNDEVRDIGALQISPTEITRVAPDEKPIGRRDAIKEAIEFNASVPNQIELPSTRPSFAPRDRRERIAPEVANAVDNRLHRVTAEKADRKFPMSIGRKAII